MSVLARLLQGDTFDGEMDGDTVAAASSEHSQSSSSVGAGRAQVSGGTRRETNGSRGDGGGWAAHGEGLGELEVDLLTKGDESLGDDLTGHAIGQHIARRTTNRHPTTQTYGLQLNHSATLPDASAHHLRPSLRK